MSKNRKLERLEHQFRHLKVSVAKWFSSHRYGKVFVRGGCLLLFVLLTSVCQYIYLRSLVHVVDMDRFQRVMTEKEEYANDVLKDIRSNIEKDDLESVMRNAQLCEESEKQEVAFHIYRGDDLLFWTNKNIAIQGVSDFDLSRTFFYEAENASVVVIQSFVKEYRCVALVKIKDAYLPKKNSLGNYFAKAFGLPVSVLVSKEKVKDSEMVSLDHGHAFFYLSNTMVKGESLLFVILTSFCWILSIAFLFLFASSLLTLFSDQYGSDSKRYKSCRCIVFASLLALLGVFVHLKLPGAWFDNGFLRMMTYSSKWATSISHLFLYTLFAYGFLFLTYYYIPFSKMDMSKKTWSLYLRVFLIKAIPFALLFLLYAVYYDWVMHSDMNVAVSYIQDIRVESFFLLLLMLLWIHLYYCIVKGIRVFYADKSITTQLVIIHIALFIVSAFVCIANGWWMEFIFLFIVSLLILFVDLYEMYYTVSTFLYTAPVAFVLINMIVSMSYNYCQQKNRNSYHSMAREMSTKNCVYEDEIAENYLKEKSVYVSIDNYWKNMGGSDYDEEVSIENYLWSSYFKSFDDKYDLEVQVVEPYDSLTIRKTNYERMKVPNLLYVANQFRSIPNSQFYANQSELLAISYIGVFPYGSKTLYLKFYRKPTYDRQSFLERLLQQYRQPINFSQAKYKLGDLSYASGDFRYPAEMSWVDPYVSSMEGEFSLNYYTHYVRFSDGGRSVSVVSVPERHSYIYVILVTYLFATYIIVVLGCVVLRRGWSRFFERKSSLLTKMQQSFIVPIMITFVVLALVTVPFFMDQFEKTQYRSIKDNANVVQQNVAGVVGTSTEINDFSSELSSQVKYLSNLFRVDILLYDKDGRLSVSSRPLFRSKESRRASLVNPRIRFGRKPELFMTETVYTVDCYSHYSKAYNTKNECIGYINLLSHRNYYNAKSEIYNILVVVLDIYIFITIISIFIIWLLNRQTAKPLSQISERLTQLQLTGKNSLIDYPENDEIGELVNQYNKMVEQLRESAEKLARSEREFAWTEMARRIAHEIKNPLTPMKLSVQQCLRRRAMDPDGFDEYFEKTCKILIDQIDNLSNIASEFSSFAKAAEARCSKMDIVDKLSSTVELFENNTEDVTFQLNTNGYDHEYVWMDDKQVLQIFNNLFRNAIQSIPNDRKGRVEVSFVREGNSAIISIKDNGCGIPDENRNRMFQPNFTTKTSGMGLGLAIVKNILTSSNGDIWFDSKVGEGTTFYVKIPIYDENA